MSTWLKPRTDGVEIFVRLTPRSSHDMVDGLLASADDRRYLAVRVRAVPEKGKANTGLEDLIARWVETSKSSVKVTGGLTSRIKTVTISGDPGSLQKRLLALVDDSATAR